MLQRPSLRLLPRNHMTPATGMAWPAPAGARCRLINDGDATLGFARCMRGPSWFGCGPQQLDVCETEDASLVMSVQCGWFSFGLWHVYDAEGNRIGGIVGRHLLDEQGCRFASIWDEGLARHVIRGRRGTPLAWIETAGDGATLLRFADDLDANPFLRMLLLAAALLMP